MIICQFCLKCYFLRYTSFLQFLRKFHMEIFVLTYTDMSFNIYYYYYYYYLGVMGGIHLTQLVRWQQLNSHFIDIKFLTYYTVYSTAFAGVMLLFYFVYMFENAVQIILHTYLRMQFSWYLIHIWECSPVHCKTLEKKKKSHWSWKSLKSWLYFQTAYSKCILNVILY